ncbi:MAG: RnfABCDGE type electron transport complex subunit G [Bacteroidales bacterium]
MAKTESTLKNMLLSLTLISLGASAALGFAYKFTEKPIELSLLNKKLQAIKMVVPEFTNNPDNDMYKLAVPGGDSIEVYPAKKDTLVIGYAIKTYSEKGFSGRITLMAGFSPEGKVTGITVLEQKETPGLGTKMADTLFRNQFTGKDPALFKVKVKKDGGDVDAITAATISSRAFCDAIDKAHNALMKGGKK